MQNGEVAALPGDVRHARLLSGPSEVEAVPLKYGLRTSPTWPPDPESLPNPERFKLPETTPLPVLVRTAKLRWRIENDYREMKQALGLAHFEGRTWPGRHHHVTLVPAAHAFCTLQRLSRSPKETASA